MSLPLIQFILLRWYFRLLIWTRFLWQVSRIDLRLVAIHPDRAGGLGFLSTVTYAFAPLLAGQGVLLAGVMANKIFYAGAKLTDFKLELLAMVIMMLFFVLAPLLVFTPRLARTKRMAWRNTAGSPSVTCASLTRNGCAAERRPTNRWWAARTCNRWPIWATALKS